MVVDTYTENPIITLESSDYSGYGSLDVYASDLKSANVGDSFIPMYGGGCGRAVERDSLTIVFKGEDGVAAVLRTDMSSDSPSPEWWYEAKLIWFSLH